MTISNTQLRGISNLISIDRCASEPLYQQIYESFRNRIIRGGLRPGELVLSTRSLARSLRISRIPVLTAYAQLLAEGYFESRVGAGTFQCSSLPDQTTTNHRRMSQKSPVPAAKRIIARRALQLPAYESVPWLRGLGAFSVSQPAYEQFPFHIWSNLVMRHCRNPHTSDLHYGGPMGFAPLREAISTYLRTARAVQCDPGQVMIVAGSQQALEISARVLLDTGDPAWVE